MAITYGNSTSTNDQNPETDGTTLVAPTITGSDTVLLLFAIGNCSGLENPTTVTYDSVSISSNTLFTGFYVNYTQIHGWYVKNPGSAKNFFVDFGGSTLISDLTLVAVYYTGVDQSTTFRTASTGSGTSNPATVNVTNSQTNDLIAGCFGLNDVASDDGYTSGRVGAGQTYRGREVGGVSNVQGAWCDEPGAGGTVTHSWDFVDNASAGFVVAAIPLIPAAGGIAYGSLTSIGGTGYQSTYTLTAPTITGSDTFLIVCIIGNRGSPQSTIYQVTYNSVDISANTLFSPFLLVNYMVLQAWYVINPTSAATFYVNYDANPPAAADALAIYFTGVHQTTPFRTAATATGLSNPATVDVTNSQVGDMIVGLFGLNDTAAADGLTEARMGAGQTYRTQLTDEVPDSQCAVCTEAGASGTVTHSWEFVDNADAGFVVAAIPLIPAAGASTAGTIWPTITL